MTNLILSGCVLDPDVLLKEIEEARGLGAKVESIKNLIISDKVPLICPWHVAMDVLREEELYKNKLGTTKGIVTEV